MNRHFGKNFGDGSKMLVSSRPLRKKANLGAILPRMATLRDRNDGCFAVAVNRAMDLCRVI